jgi:hypothetical protein
MLSSNSGDFFNLTITGCSYNFQHDSPRSLLGAPQGTKVWIAHGPFKSFVIPRPIGWISTTSKDGQANLGPFNNVSFDPPTILFIAQQSEYKKRSKDSVVNARSTGEFVWNMVT